MLRVGESGEGVFITCTVKRSIMNLGSWHSIVFGSKHLKQEGMAQILGGSCLNQDLQDLGIFRIAGDRLMLVQRILFASVERAVRRGTTIWDAPKLECGICLSQEWEISYDHYPAF